MALALEFGPDRDVAALLLMMRFDAQTYFQRNPDLASGGVEIATSHYAQFGWREGRQPCFDLTVGVMQQLLAWLKLGKGERVMLERWLAEGIQSRLEPSLADHYWLADMLSPTTSYLPVLTVGDSHAAFFQSAPFLERGMFPALFLGSGVSARGLANPRSRAGFGTRLLELLERLKEQGRVAPLVLKFGQVDIEFVYNFRRIERKQTHFDFDDALVYAEDTAGRYAQFLRKLRAAWPQPIIVTSIFPPCLVDETLQEGYINGHVGLLNSRRDINALSTALRKLELPDLLTRTEIHRRFNGLLREASAKADVGYLEEYDELLNADGVVADEFIADHQGTDHHLSWRSAVAQRRMRAVADACLAMIKEMTAARPASPDPVIEGAAEAAGTTDSVAMPAAVEGDQASPAAATVIDATLRVEPSARSTPALKARARRGKAPAAAVAAAELAVEPADAAPAPAASVAENLPSPAPPVPSPAAKPNARRARAPASAEPAAVPPTKARQRARPSKGRADDLPADAA